MRAWLLGTTLGFPRWRLGVAVLACIVTGAVLNALWGPVVAQFFSWLGVLFLGRPRQARIDPVDWSAADPARTAQASHQAAEETGHALGEVATESRAREADGARAAAEDPIDTVRLRVERRARR